MRLRGRVDANQKDIVAALRRLGATVHSLSPMGEGCPDLLVGFRQHTYLLEVKAPKGSLTEDQTEWIDAWRGSPVYVVRNVDEALRVIGITERKRWETRIDVHFR